MMSVRSIYQTPTLLRARRYPFPTQCVFQARHRQRNVLCRKIAAEKEAAAALAIQGKARQRQVCTWVRVAANGLLCSEIV